MEKLDVQAKRKQAYDLFVQGYSCAQSVFAAFAEEMGLSLSQALKIASGVGAGLGGLRLTCGAITAMAMVLGSLQGFDTPDNESKKVLYARIRGLHDQFVAEYETVNCRALLVAAGVAVKAEPSPRTAEYYRVRPCVRYVEKCAELVAEELNRQS